MVKKISELRDMTVEELARHERNIKKELFELRSQSQTGTVEKPHKMRQIRKEIAKIKTLIKEKFDAADKEKKS